MLLSLKYCSFHMYLQFFFLNSQGSSLNTNAYENELLAYLNILFGDCYSKHERWKNKKAIPRDQKLLKTPKQKSLAVCILTAVIT